MLLQLESEIDEDMGEIGRCDDLFQRQQPTSGGTVSSFRPANSCQPIPPNRSVDGFPDSSQFAAAKLTHYSLKTQRPSDSSKVTPPALRR